MEKWNYILREELGEGGKEGRSVFLADRMLAEETVEYGAEQTVQTALPEYKKPGIQRVVIKSTVCESPYLRHTLREVNCLQKLCHPGIPEVLEYQKMGTSYHLVLPYIEGKSLKEKLEETELALPELFFILRQLGEILHYLHQQTPPILYRDLKPEHIRIDREGGVHLLDFDGVMLTGNEAERIGNERFSAPEQLLPFGEVDVRSDIYAFGRLAELLFYHIPTGILTEKAEKKWKLFLKQCTQEKKEKRCPNMQKVLEKLQKLEALSLQGS